jgi:DNA mismatch repair protein MutS
MHQVQDGAASKSYGLQVAQLAGVPKKVIQQAKQKLAQLEQGTPALPASSAQQASASQPLQQSLLLETAEHPLLDQLRLLAVDDLTPRQALEMLYQLKRQL